MKFFLTLFGIAILGLILCVTLALSQEQVARMSLGVVGGGVPAAGGPCSTSNDSLLVDYLGTSVAYSFHVYQAVKFTLGATTTLTEYIGRVCKETGTGNTTLSIWTDNANKPGTTITGTDVAVAMDAWISCTSGAQNVNFALGTPKTGISSGTYWLVKGPSDVTVGVNLTFRANADSRLCYEEANDDSWTCINDYLYESQVWGCQ